MASNDRRLSSVMGGAEIPLFSVFLLRPSVLYLLLPVFYLHTCQAHLFLCFFFPTLCFYKYFSRNSKKYTRSTHSLHVQCLWICVSLVNTDNVKPHPIDQDSHAPDAAQTSPSVFSSVCYHLGCLGPSQIIQISPPPLFQLRFFCVSQPKGKPARYGTSYFPLNSESDGVHRQILACAKP